MARKEGLNLASLKGLSLEKKAVHFRWGNDAGHPAFRHALTLHVIAKLRKDSRLPARVEELIRTHPPVRDAFQAIFDAVGNNESSFFEVMRDAVNRFAGRTNVPDAIRWEGIRFVLSSRARGQMLRWRDLLKHLKEEFPDKTDDAIASILTRTDFGIARKRRPVANRR